MWESLVLRTVYWLHKPASLKSWGEGAQQIIVGRMGVQPVRRNRFWRRAARRTLQTMAN
jgi:hypothetical protein